MWSDNPFAHPAWLEAHTAVLEPGLVAECWSGDLGAVTTVHALGGPLRLLGDRMSDRLDLDAGALVAAAAAARSRRQPVRFGPLPVTGAQRLAEAFPGARLVAQTPSPTIAFDGADWPDYLDGTRARRRRRMATQAAQLIAAPDVDIDVARDRAQVIAQLPALVHLHRQRFGAASESFTDPKVAFLETVLAPMADDGVVEVRTLRVGGRISAALLCFRARGAVWFYQSGWDVADAARSVGRALLIDAIEQACRDGHDFLLLRGGEPYKAWWATGDDPVATVVVDRW